MEYPSDRKAYVNGILIAVNVLYFLYLETAGSTGDVFFMYHKGAMEAAAVLKDHEYYRLFTAMFMHFGINHLINNMLVLFVIGDNLERALGHVKYLILYLCCGIGAGWISLYFQEPDVLTVSAGASGAIFGVIEGLLYAVAVGGYDCVFPVLWIYQCWYRQCRPHIRPCSGNSFWRYPVSEAP